MSFRPKLLPSLLTLIGLGLLLWLGTWQLGRYHEKLAAEALQASRALDAPEHISSFEGRDLAALNYKSIVLTGTLDHSRTLLFKHRHHQKRPGMWVATPLVLEGTREAILVNQGWLPFAQAEELASTLKQAPAERARYKGVLSVLPQNIADTKNRALLASHQDLLTRSISSWDTYDIEAIQRALPYTTPARPAVLVLESSHSGDPFPIASTDALTRPYMTSERHMSYAVFWYSLAGVLVLLWAAGSSGLVGSYRYRTPQAAAEQDAH